MRDCDQIRALLDGNAVDTTGGSNVGLPVFAKVRDTVRCLGRAREIQGAGTLAVLAGISHTRISRGVLDGDHRQWFVVRP